MLEKVIENWTSRLDYIRASHGSPMPEIIFKISPQPLTSNTLPKDNQKNRSGHWSFPSPEAKDAGPRLYVPIPALSLTLSAVKDTRGYAGHALPWCHEIRILIGTIQGGKGSSINHVHIVIMSPGELVAPGEE
ncbi:hypothetical protein TNCV_4350831 [Trichonephila clavipes]|nr:hypothetical protein TNCV_4350831 [Trichonephila clavipes]